MPSFKLFKSCFSPKLSNYDPEASSSGKHPVGPSVNEKTDGPANATNEIQQLAKNNTNLQAQLDEARRNLALAEKTIQNEASLRKEVADLKSELTQTQSQLQQTKVELESTKRSLQNAKKEANGWEEALKEEKLKNAKQNEERDAIMESLKSYLDTHDDVDASSLKKELSNVNDLVEQLASDMIFRWDTPDEKSTLEPTSPIPQLMNPVLGNHLVQALLTCNVHDDGSPSLLQYAFQIAVTARVFELFQAKTFNAEEYQLIHKLSQRIRNDEIQPVYGRWRTVTQRYLRLIDDPTREAKILAQFSRDATADIRHIALLFGYPVSESHEDLHSELQQSLSDIAKKTTRLSSIVTTEVVTKDYEIYRPTSGKFDEESMDPPFKLEDQSQDDTVFGSTSLGMSSISKPGRQQVPPEHRIFQKAVVLTEASLQEILHPGPAK